MNSPAVHLYVSQDLVWFEAPTDAGYGVELTQGDGDCRRVYRRLDSLWWTWLARMHAGYPELAKLRARVVELRGEDAVAKAEAIRPALDYFPPVPRFPVSHPSEVCLAAR